MLFFLIEKKKKWLLCKLPKSRLHGVLPLDVHMSVSGEATGDIHPALMRAEAGG